MADDADRADDRIQNAIKDGMDRVKRELGRSLPATGFCHWCNDPVKGRVFCSKDCSEDWEHDRLRRKATGR